MPSKRFEVIEGSEHLCCYSWTVVDTETVISPTGALYEVGAFGEEQDARNVCRMLNGSHGRSLDEWQNT